MEHQQRLADANLVAIAQHGAGDPLVVDERAGGAGEVFDDVAILLSNDARVGARHKILWQDQVIVRSTTDADRS
jgi:hypothetical protein